MELFKRAVKWSEIGRPLTDAYKSGIMICMRTTLNLDETLVDEAQELTGLRTKTDLVHAGLRALIEKAARERLALLSGAVREASAPYRRRPASRKR